MRQSPWLVRCVDHLMSISTKWSVGLISSGMFADLPQVDFVSLDHECADEHDIQHLRSNDIRVYLWNADMWGTYPEVDGLIKNYVYADLRCMEDIGKEPSLDDFYYPDGLLGVAGTPQRPPVGREGNAHPTHVE